MSQNCRKMIIRLQRKSLLFRCFIGVPYNSLLSCGSWVRTPTESQNKQNKTYLYKIAWKNNGSKLLIHKNLSLLFFFVFKYILSFIPLLCPLFVNGCQSIGYKFNVLRNHPCVLQICYQNSANVLSKREKWKSLMTLNDFDPS